MGMIFKKYIKTHPFFYYHHIVYI